MLIAEIGLAHDGSLGNALAFIDAVADAGAEAVKFQCHDGDPNTDPPASGCELWQDFIRQEYWKRTAFDIDEWKVLQLRAHANGIQFGVTPFSIEALDKVAPLCDFIKISRQHAHRELHILASETGQPVIWTLTDADAGCGPSRSIRKTLLLDDYCDNFNGISDHSATIWPCLRAAALGAEIFEVHVCFDRRQFGPDIPYSITIDELAQLAKGIKAMR